MVFLNESLVIFVGVHTEHVDARVVAVLKFQFFCFGHWVTVVCCADSGAAEAVVHAEFEPMVEGHGEVCVCESHAMMLLHYLPPQQDFL